MGKKKQGDEHSVGYKKPPRHTQFQPGQSGNPQGRPKKAATLQDVLAKGLRARVSIIKDGKRQTISTLDAIVKQMLNLAARGDPKAAAFIFKQLRENALGAGDRLSDLVEEFRSVYSRREAEDRARRPANDDVGKGGEQS